MIVRVEELSSKKLSEIARYCDLDSSSTEVNVTGIVSQAQSVIAGDLFLGLAGTNTHGAKFAELAITNGAVAILTDVEGASIISNSEVPVLVISNPRLIAGNLTAWFYGFPLNSIFAIGITGTNGKTTTTTLLHQLWQSANIESALIGTVATQIGSEILPSKRTTPESDELQALFAVMRERHIRNLAMEVSSHALSQNRVTGSKFKAVAFTNLTQDSSSDAIAFVGLSITRLSAACPAPFGASVCCTTRNRGKVLCEGSTRPQKAPGGQRLICVFFPRRSARVGAA